MISTRDLSQLPPIDRLKALTQSLALLDAILAPEWAYRYHAFNAHWGAGAALASMRDGSGDELFALFTPAGVLVKGFAHEAPMSPYRERPPRVWPGVLDGVPAALARFLDEPALSPADTTFCIWRTDADAAWQRGAIEFPAGRDPDGSGALLALLDGDPHTYRAWAEGYYERAVDPSAVRQVYAHRPLTAALVRRLNPAVSLQALAPDIREIAYPQVSAR